jgi:hypothetical protein
MREETLLNFASACGSANDRRRAAGESTPIIRLKQMPLVTSARFCGVERASSRGIRGDVQPVERSKPRVGHGG